MSISEILRQAQIAQYNWEQMMSEMGHKTITTFYSDFTIADMTGGASAVHDTYNRATKEWKDDYKYLTELVIVLNHKIWEHFEKGNEQLAKVYQDLWDEADAWCMHNLKGDELDYFMSVTD